MNKAKFSVILIAAAIIVFSVGGILLTAGKTFGQFLFGRSFAEGQLKDYVNSVLKQELNGARCQAVDSDGNGYVSCDYTLAARPEVTQSIECSAWGLDGLINRGCRTRYPNFRP